MNQKLKFMIKIVFKPIKYLVPVILLPCILLSKEKQLSCKISDEFENGEITTRKVYENFRLRIFFDTESNWINDISFMEFKKNVKLFNSSTISFKKEKNKINFKLKEFFTEEKDSVNIEYEISYEIKKGLINYRKNYFDFDGNTFFTTTVKGICKEIVNSFYFNRSIYSLSHSSLVSPFNFTLPSSFDSKSSRIQSTNSKLVLFRKLRNSSRLIFSDIFHLIT